MMAENRPRSKKGRGRTKGTDRIRARLLTEWRGGIDPPNPNRNIHEPAEYLDDLLKAVGLTDGVDEQRLKDAWSTVAGEFVSKHTVPESIQGGILVLRVVQPAMKFHLQQMSGKLLSNLHRELGKGTVKKIVFKIG
ncbi:DUF721 domain-containing protein [Verrucomicrobiaceae bacterium R5-34]|uniref:DUF721 domain-containing protein n=1 Tax=Oceaniferula flava TaxID=2800421 RepID=A0AAE2S9G7_9BACT|nr:DUF721 domain-containing protein [Oceaniferula flavus]MBK1832094.1 DUF721 domain-containing protein [Verrucomicrobiaceae bacterium R5-34]MBK1854178.1 DUF721 domain-containing protein [Oceaniferula flavus]MBM1135484.1 DUF721 domain-containing protein [Oceaniferula flavus]